MDARQIRLTAPCSLRHRALAVRLVAEACRLARGERSVDDLSPGYDVRDPFDVAVVSAFAEIYNNVALHACAGLVEPMIELRIALEDGGVTIELVDPGKTFDPSAVASPDLDAMPEGGMGLHIARAMLDVVDYEPGPPNLWRLIKRTVSDAVPDADVPALDAVTIPTAQR
ncbi:MAG: ATP-binding protein [Kofleriaceae bacterium]